MDDTAVVKLIMRWKLFLVRELPVHKDRKILERKLLDVQQTAPSLLTIFVHA
jgi:hypothetical protein